MTIQINAHKINVRKDTLKILLNNNIWFGITFKMVTQLFLLT